MNALVASVIRTLVPHIVTQLASLFLMINIQVPDDIRLQLSAVVGFVLFAIYYGGIRVLEQQWPALGILLGLPSSPDTYSKGDPAATTSPAASTPLDVPAVAEATLSLNDVAPASTFPSAAVNAALAAPEPVIVTPVFTPPAA
jgi:hypothetical protein